MRRWNDAPSATAGTSEVNLTPLIDVSLVLVVILLLATPLAFESAFAVRRAQAATRDADDDHRQPRIEVMIASADSIVVNRQTTNLATLDATLDVLLTASGAAPVVVSCDDAVAHGTFVTVLDGIKRCGATDIAITGR
jgi:biopolymer transport protein ExbD